MRTNQRRPDPGAAWRRLAIGLLALCAPTSLIALGHIIETAQRGVICGASDGLAHCWACYAAPMLALAAIACWRVAATMPSPVHVRR
jgi:hypothetical protein